MPRDEGKNGRRTDPRISKELLEIKKLQGLLKEKDTLIKQSSGEKAYLEAENLNLKKEIKQKDSRVQDFQKEQMMIEKKYEQKIELDKKMIAKKDNEITRLEKQLEKMSSSKNTDDEIMKELIKTRLQFQEVNLHNDLNMEELIETRSNLAIRKEKLQKTTSELSSLREVVAEHQFEKIAFKNELELIRKRIKSSFTAEEMSGYLNSTIESFNNDVNTVDSVDSAVDYVINGMDIDLKAQIYKDDQNGMMFSSADIASKNEDSLSSVKFSIRAVPKL